MYDQLVSLISDLGFPIVVSVYLLIRFEDKIDLLVQSLQGLREDISAVIKNQERK